MKILELDFPKLTADSQVLLERALESIKFGALNGQTEEDAMHVLLDLERAVERVEAYLDCLARRDETNPNIIMKAGH